MARKKTTAHKGEVKGVTVQRRAAIIRKKRQDQLDARKRREDFSHAAVRIVREATEDN
ncbi:MAG: hypothetical protein LAO06_10175 [Acidobacteriia bacterium]|nr:hypothetical protein [Terriglobia bacterium]